MDSIEQAREALENYGDNPDAVRIIDAGYKALDYDRAMAISKHDVWTILKGALAALSPSTPVDGVGAEPTDDDLVRRGDVFAVVQMMLEQFDATENDDLRGGLHVMITDIPALASLEAEARLRERVTEAERLRFEGELDKWMKIIGAGITGYQPEAYAVMDAACRELVSLRKRGAEPVVDGWMSGADFISSYYGDDDEPPVAETNPLATGAEVRCDPIDVATDVACGVGNTYGGDVLSGGDRAVVELGIRRLVGAGWTVAAEARLAQAEGGPKVTDNMVERACRMHHVGWSLWKEPQKKTAREVMRAALEAALHPQSAAGEEGK